jgi:prevent-host-death family protein
MKTIGFTEFRNHASDLMTAVENGETLLVIRHGRPIAEISPVTARQTPCTALVDNRRGLVGRHHRGAGV